jgi:hypothetical protein
MFFDTQRVITVAVYKHPAPSEAKTTTSKIQTYLLREL